MSEFLQLMIAGAATGAIYSLVASGLTLSYSATGIFNFAYGAVAFCAAMLYYQLNTGLGWPIPFALLVAVGIFGPGLGYLLNIAVFRPLARATEEVKIMATVGLLIALPALCRLVIEIGITRFKWGIPDGKLVALPPGILSSPPTVFNLPFDVILDSNRLAILLCAVLVAVALWFIMRHTKLGLQMRAVVDRPDLAAMRGVDERKTSAAAWVIGTTLAALAGVVGAPVLNTLQESDFNLLMFIAASAAVLGRLRSIPLAFAGGLLIGITQNFVRRYVPIANEINGFTNSVPFLVMLVGLVLLARDRSRRGGNVVAQAPPVEWTDDLPVWRRRLPWGIAVAAFFLWTFVFLRTNSFWLSNFATGLAFAIVFLSFVVVTGIGGMVSLAQAAFVSVASLIAGRVLIEIGLPWAVAVLIGTLFAIALGVIVALPALRLGGLPLALATLALGFLGDRVLFKWNWLRNFQSGWRVKKPSLGPFDLSNRPTMIVFLAIILAILVWMTNNLRNSASGRSILAVRNSEPAAVTSGLSIPRIKLGVFAVSAGIAGFGGVILATVNGSASDGRFVAETGLTWLAAVVLFGIRKPQGALLAGLVVATSTAIYTGGWHPVFFPDFLHWDGFNSSIATHVSAALIGVGAIQVSRESDGILAITARQNRMRRDRRRAKREGVSVESSTSTIEATPILKSVNQNPDSALLVLDSVSTGYGPVEVLREISLTVNSGKITAVLGPNGAGKSTLCSAIVGLLPATTGSVYLEGRDITSLATPARAKRGVVLAPEARGIFPDLTVQENLDIWLTDVDERQQVFDRFPVLGVRRDLPAGSLSGGEQQMLTLGPLMVRPPRVLVADEPTLGLAPMIVDQILELFVELREKGVALILVEEKAKGVLEISDSVSFLSLGTVIWSGRQEDVTDELLRHVYLGTEIDPDIVSAVNPDRGRRMT